MGIAYNTIAFRGELCDGCGDCMIACAETKSGTRDLAQARLRILPAETPDATPDLALCRQCGMPDCATHCPAGALRKSAASGVIEWDAARCVNCLLCTAGCAYGGITYDAAIGHVSKCDTCAGDPACVRACKSAGEQSEKGAGQKSADGEADQAGRQRPGELSACQKQQTRSGNNTHAGDKRSNGN